MPRGAGKLKAVAQQVKVAALKAQVGTVMAWLLASAARHTARLMLVSDLVLSYHMLDRPGEWAYVLTALLSLPYTHCVCRLGLRKQQLRS